MSAPASQPTAHFSETYDKARRAYGFVCALLLGWELVGITIAKDPLSSVRITLESPEAVPYILVALVLYFGFRLTIEWFHTDVGRRRQPASRIDVTVSHTLAVLAVGLFVVQTIILRAQIVNVLTVADVSFFAIGAIAAQPLVSPLVQVALWRQARPGVSILVRLLVSGGLVWLGLQLGRHYFGSAQPWAIAMGAVCGLGFRVISQTFAIDGRKLWRRATGSARQRLDEWLHSGWN